MLRGCGLIMYFKCQNNQFCFEDETPFIYTKQIKYDRELTFIYLFLGLYYTNYEYEIFLCYKNSSKYEINK